MFWPKEVWGRHARSLEEFRAPQHADAAVACLNELVTDALRWGLCLKTVCLGALLMSNA